MSTNPDAIQSAAEGAWNSAADAAGKVADQVAEVGREAVEKIESSRRNLAQGMSTTAHFLRSYAPARMADQASSTADVLDSVAEYLRTHEMGTMMGDLTEVVRRNPGPSLVAAIAVGFLLGYSMRPRD